MTGTLAALALVAQLSVAVQAPESVSVNTPLTVQVQVTAPGTEVPRIIAPPFRPFAGTRTAMSSSTVSYPPWTNVTLSYVLTASRSGTFTIPPFEARLGSQRARSRPLVITVRPAPDLGVPAIVARAKLDTAARVNFHAIVVPETVYVGQQATYQVAVFLDDEVRLRLRRNPEFIPPEMRSMLSYDLALGRTLLQERRAGGRHYEVHVFQRAIFPLAPGRHVIPEARLVYSLPLSSSFFSREETHTLRAERAVVVALDPPVEGRPADFAGAVGDYTVTAVVDTTRARVGDPLVLTLRVSGKGNVKLLPRPPLTIPWATSVPADERVSVDSASLIVRGAKEFDWVLTPRRAGPQELPPIRYAFWEPTGRVYQIATTAPETLTIAPGTLAVSDSAARDSLRVLALRPALRGPASPPLFTHMWFWAIIAFAPVPAALVGYQRRPREERRASAAATLRTLARAADAPDSATLRRVFIRALSERLFLSPATITSGGALTRALRRAGVTDELAVEAERFVTQLDAAAYGTRTALGAEAARKADEIFRRIDAEARTRRSLEIHRSAMVLLAVAVLGAAPVAWALATQPTPPELFGQGLNAYQQRRFGDARDLFEEVTWRAPRAPDGWANFGTASWALSDTAGAVLGWQRALRLDPLAGDVRDRLIMLGDLADGEAEVPALPSGVPASAAALLWIAAWGLAYYRLRVPGRFSPRWPVVVGAASMALGVVTIEVDREIAGRDLAVVRRTSTLRDGPALSADADAAVGAGEVVRTVQRQSAWTRVKLPGGREGWVETDRLASLARD